MGNSAEVIESVSCPSCKLTKPVSGFWKNKSKARGHDDWCILCSRARRSTPERKARKREQDRLRPKQRQASPEWKRNNNLIRYHGIDSSIYFEMLRDQGGVCKICLCPPAEGKMLCVDHCHSTLEIRGLLCPKCNKALGLFSDSKVALERAISYLLTARTGRHSKG